MIDNYELTMQRLFLGIGRDNTTSFVKFDIKSAHINSTVKLSEL